MKIEEMISDITKIYIPPIDWEKELLAPIDFYSSWPRMSWERDKKVFPEKVIFHNPATIVYWNDGTKTVVKCDPRDTYNKESGLALCYMKKMLGGSRAFNDVLKKWTEEK